METKLFWKGLNQTSRLNHFSFSRHLDAVLCESGSMWTLYVLTNWVGWEVRYSLYKLYGVQWSIIEKEGIKFISNFMIPAVLDFLSNNVFPDEAMNTSIKLLYQWVFPLMCYDGLMEYSSFWIRMAILLVHELVWKKMPLYLPGLIDSKRYKVDANHD